MCMCEREKKREREIERMRERERESVRERRKENEIGREIHIRLTVSFVFRMKEIV